MIFHDLSPCNQTGYGLEQDQWTTAVIFIIFGAFLHQSLDFISQFTLISYNWAGRSLRSPRAGIRSTSICNLTWFPLLDCNRPVSRYVCQQLLRHGIFAHRLYQLWRQTVHPSGAVTGPRRLTGVFWVIRPRSSSVLTSFTGRHHRRFRLLPPYPWPFLMVSL